MTPERLQEILDAYGGDPRRWPVDERDAAEALCDASVAARHARDEACRLDTLLDRLPAPAARPFDAALLAARVMAVPQRPDAGLVETTLNAVGVRRRAVAGFALAAALAGFVVGWGLPADDAAAGEDSVGFLPAPIAEIDEPW